MKRAIFFLCLGIFIALVIQPNLSQSIKSENVKVPERDATSVRTNDNLSHELTKTKAKICIDAARGGSNVGYSKNQITEKDLNLQLAKAIGKNLEQEGYEVVYTRSDDQIPYYNTTDEDAQNRIEIAKENGAEYLICVSLSSDSNPLTKGFSIFTQPDDKTTALSQKMADNLSTINFSTFDGLDNDHYSNFPILGNLDLPSMIIDFGYVTNKEDYDILSDPYYQDRIGQAVAKAFLN